MGLEQKSRDAHKDHLKSKANSAEELLNRLEVCKFYRLTKNSERNYTLAFGSELPKFVQVLLERYFLAISIKVET